MMYFINAAASDLYGSLDRAENPMVEIDLELIKQLCNSVGTDAAAMDAIPKMVQSAITHFVESESLSLVMGWTSGLETRRLLSRFDNVHNVRRRCSHA